MITLGELRSKVLQLLRDHNNILSVMSFTRCYEETFGPLNKAEFYVNRASEGEPDKVLVDKDSVLLQNYVPLEHLITCVPDVCIRLTANGIRVVTLSQDLSQGNYCSYFDLVVDLLKRMYYYSALENCQ